MTLEEVIEDALEEWMNDVETSEDEAVFVAKKVREHFKPLASEIRSTAAEFVDWDVMHGHESTTPEVEKSHKHADRLNSFADKLRSCGGR